MGKKNDDPVSPKSMSSDVKVKTIELDRKIGHNSVMSIREFLIDIYDPDHLLDQVIHDMENIGDTVSDGANQIGLLFVVDLLVNGSTAL